MSSEGRAVRSVAEYPLFSGDGEEKASVVFGAQVFLQDSLPTTLFLGLS